MTETNWSKYGEWRHPLQYWTNKLIDYLSITDGGLVENNPKVIKVFSSTIHYQFENSQKVYSIEKRILNEQEPIDTNLIYPNGIILWSHRLNVPFKDSTILLEVTSVVEDEKIIAEILERIYSNNPHWKMDILSDEQLRNNISDVLRNDFESVHYINFTDKLF